MSVLSRQLVEGQLSCPWQCCSLQCRHALSPALAFSNHHFSQNKIVPYHFLMLQSELSSSVCNLCIPLAAGNCHAANERGRMTSKAGRQVGRQAGRLALCSPCFIPANAFHQQQQQNPSRSWVWAKVHNSYIFQHRLPGAGTFSV